MIEKKDTILEIKNISKEFGDKGVLNNVSFSIDKGQIICLLGPSGSGKTTLLRIIAGLEDADNGSVSYLDTEDKTFLDSTFVFQEYNLWTDKTVLDNILIAPLATGRNHSEVKEEAVSLLKKFGLEDQANKYPDFLSGGQKQRLAIIRALIAKPKVLLLDEITSALDPELVKNVLSMIKVLAKEGQTMIIVTHHLKFASEIADKIVFLDGGKVVQEAETKDFIYAQDNLRIRDYINQELVTKNEINTYEGYDNFQAYHLGSLKLLKEGGTIYIVGATGDRWYECMGEYLDEYNKLRLEKKIKYKLLLYKEEESEKQERIQHPDLTSSKLIPEGMRTPTNYLVIEDNVVIQSLDGTPTVIEIHNEKIAKSYLNYFNLLWNIGKEL